MLLLYYHPHSPYSRKVRIVLEEKKLPYEIKIVSLESGENKQPEFLKQNLLGQVPVLVDKELTLAESGAIVEYIEEQYPIMPLLPSNVRERARVRMIDRAFDTHLGRNLGILFKQYYLIKPGERNESLVAEAFRNVQQHLAICNGWLEGRDFFGGSMFTVADAAHAHAFLNGLPLFNIDITPHKNLQAWIERVSLRPSVVKTNPGPFRNPLAQKKSPPKSLHAS